MNTRAESVLRGSYTRPQYVSQDMLNIHLQGMKDRAASEEKITGARFDRLEAIMEKNMMELKGEITGFRGELKGEVNGLRGELKVMNERIERNLAESKAAISDIRGDVKTLSARVDSFQPRRYWDIAGVGIIIGAVIGLIQMFSK